MIPNNAYDYCCEDISLIENYEAALADPSETEWVCHHRLGIELNKTHKELKVMGLYFKRPASELIFLTKAEHLSLHHSGKPSPTKGKKHSAETRAKISASMKGKKKPPLSTEHRAKISASLKQKHKWLTPDGEIKIMDKSNAKRHHPDWVRIEKVD